MRSTTLFAFIALATRSSLAGAQTITGTVMDTTTNTRVAAAQVMVLQVGASMTALTDPTGKFRFDVEPGMVSLRITALGYSDLQSGVMTLQKGERIAVLALLSTQPVEIAPIYVLAKTRRPATGLEGFYQRRKRSGFGYFMDEKAIERIPAFELTEYLRRVPGVWVGSDHVRLRHYCSDAAYLVDGMPIIGSSAFTATETVNSMVSPSEVAAIEVYKGDVGVPADLMIGALSAGRGSCGIVAIWTKR